MANTETTRKTVHSAIATAIISIILLYVGNRFGDIVDMSGRAFFSVCGDAFGMLVPSIAANPVHVGTGTTAVLSGGVLFLLTWLVWLRYVAFIGNYRTGEESGSARWGTKKEGVRFKDQKNHFNNLIFTANYGMALKRDKFDIELDRNLNVMVIGGSGSGKTRYYVKPNLMQLNTSYFVTDPKGTLLAETGAMFEKAGYSIRTFNTIEFGKSLHYNPLHYVKTDADILSFINCIISNTNGDGKPGDPFWENAERLLYTALLALLRDWFPEKDFSIHGLLTLLDLAEAREDDENFKSALDLMFLQIEEGWKYVEQEGSPASSDAATAERERGIVGAESSAKWKKVPSRFVRNYDGKRPGECGGLSPSEDFALSNYKAFKVAAGKTLKSIIISCNVRLKPLAIREVRELLKYDEMELDTLGDEFVMRPGERPGEYVKTGVKQQRSVIFGILSDTDKTFSFLFAILMWQAVDQLCRKALTAYGGKLPVPVHFIFDEFANIGRIPDFEETIAVTRSRNIGISCILQSMSQLESRYDKAAQTIVDCCDTTLFLGGKSNSTNKEIAEMIGKQTISQMTYNESSGQSPSASKGVQIQGRDLIDAAEIGKMSRKKAILLIAGTNPLMDDKYPLEKHPRYGEIDGDPFDFTEYRKRTARSGK